MSTARPPEGTPVSTVVDLRIQPLTAEAFAPFGSVMAALPDGVPFGPADAPLDLSQGTPRFYVMQLETRGRTVTAITRHRRVTQALASVGGKPWLLAVAPPPPSTLSLIHI